MVLGLGRLPAIGLVRSKDCVWAVVNVCNRGEAEAKLCAGPHRLDRQGRAEQSKADETWISCHAMPCHAARCDAMRCDHPPASLTVRVLLLLLLPVLVRVVVFCCGHTPNRFPSTMQRADAGPS